MLVSWIKVKWSNSCYKLTILYTIEWRLCSMFALASNFHTHIETHVHTHAPADKAVEKYTRIHAQTRHTLEKAMQVVQHYVRLNLRGSAHWQRATALQWWQRKERKQARIFGVDVLDCIGFRSDSGNINSRANLCLDNNNDSSSSSGSENVHGVSHFQRNHSRTCKTNSWWLNRTSKTSTTTTTTTTTSVCALQRSCSKLEHFSRGNKTQKYLFFENTFPPHSFQSSLITSSKIIEQGLKKNHKSWESSIEEKKLRKERIKIILAQDQEAANISSRQHIFINWINDFWVEQTSTQSRWL